MTDGELRSSASVRRRLTATTAAIISIGMIALVVVVLLVAWRTTDHEMDQVLDTRVAAVRDAAEVVRGKPVVADADDPTFDTSNWVADPDGTLIAGPNVPSAIRAEVNRLARGENGVVEVDSWRLRGAALRPGADVGRVVVAIDTGPYRSGLGRLVAASIVTGLVVVAGVTLLAGLIVRRALAPVATMTATAVAWSHERPDRRFGLGAPKDEITGLAAVLDGLLDRVDRAIRAEQRLTAEVAHELRTPLTVMRGEAELGAATPRLRKAERERFERIVAAADEMGSAMTTLLDAARGSGSAATADVSAVLATVAARTGLALPIVVDEPDEELVAAVPADLLGRALAPLVDNAARYGRTAVHLAAERDGDRIAVSVTDDGDGVREGVGDVFEPGVRDPASEGAGLGLALARRLARSVGGDAVLVSRKPAVLRVVVPAATELT
ncbi:sensor histidine kinase [Amnibacterium kyonggiense]|uniref:histidine kinase n=1 Tax=Amnibacterium kyonggiense TaxID=595671 RepID=A0A4R7FSB0_9MICO|nr:HAMP domain-containing sensor histidine kinase [Amnibacterium kyonggiense]TDS80710.1 signal transduction histidine kinase [Amnibacterium kyonggiense]